MKIQDVSPTSAKIQKFLIFDQISKNTLVCLLTPTKCLVYMLGTQSTPKNSLFILLYHHSRDKEKLFFFFFAPVSLCRHRIRGQLGVGGSTHTSSTGPVCRTSVVLFTMPFIAGSAGLTLSAVLPVVHGYPLATTETVPKSMEIVGVAVPERTAQELELETFSVLFQLF